MLIRKEFLIAYRNRHEALNPLLFFVLVCLLFPLAVGPSSKLLTTISAGIIWTAVLLASLMSLVTLFRAEYEDGTLELMLLANHSALALVMIKLVAHWSINILPLILLAPLIAYTYGMTISIQSILLLTLLLGTPSLILIGAIVATLTLLIPQNGMLLALLVLPLYVPILIFGTSAVDATASGLSADGPLYIMAAILVLSLTLAPLAIVSALKIGVSQ
jgi:heme exporter protein B